MDSIHDIKYIIRLIYIFIHFWLCWVFVATHRLSLALLSRDYSHWGAEALGWIGPVVAT